MLANRIEVSTSLCFVFRNFLASNWCMQEFYIAHQKVTEGNARFLIPVLLEDITLEELPRDLQTYIRTYTYIDARENDNDTLRKRIRFAMPDTPLKVLLERQQVQAGADDDTLLEGIELEHNEQDAGQGALQDGPQQIESVEAIGGMLRLLQADGSILDVYYPAHLQCESDDTDDSDNNEDTYANDNNDASDNNDNRGGSDDTDSDDNDDSGDCDEDAEIAPDCGDMVEEV